MAIQRLISLPPAAANAFAVLSQRNPPEWFAGSDPKGAPLGSGGGTSHLLAQAWKAHSQAIDFSSWLQQSQRLVIHGGGQSRRLPSYAPIGKPLIPVPVFRWSRGQRLDQTLLDLQTLSFETILTHAGDHFRLLIASGDVLLRFGNNLPEIPKVDIVGLGMWLNPEKAKDFGVFFVPRGQPGHLAFFLQKPSPARIREFAQEHYHLVDTGMWLLSEHAIRVLLRKSGWDDASEAFAAGDPMPYEFYAKFCLALGSHPSLCDPEIAQLTTAVLPLPEPEFYHFGTNQQLIESVSALQNRELDEIRLGPGGGRPHPDQYVQNAQITFPLRHEENHHLWIENSCIPTPWRLAHHHVLTGVPANNWDLELEAGVCLDFVPLNERDWCLRFYGMEDAFRGAIDDPSTRWLGRPAPNWFIARHINRDRSGLIAGTDVQQAALFPVVTPEELDPRYIEWLTFSQPRQNEAFTRQWIHAPRLSAQDLLAQVNLNRIHAQRRANQASCLPALLRNRHWSIFYKLDLDSTASTFAKSGSELPESAPSETGIAPDAMQGVRDAMFRAAVLRHRHVDNWETFEDQAFARLRDLIEGEAQLSPVAPRRSILEDQIVWARSPVRLDLAGGWTDTPPFCLEHGGKVLNLAVNLNGQPPIQVFTKLAESPHIVVRSIDLGIEQTLDSYDALGGYGEPGSGFALAKAALALAGFHPKFHATKGYSSLREHLNAFGGGLEISLLAAVPKGSGLGTSSIMAATLLAALSEVGGLGWDYPTLYTRTLALEQMLTTGGGWQDQIGGILQGIKHIETQAGLSQQPTIRWLPEHLFSPRYVNLSTQLYYTGITRMAKSILREVVRGVFLNSPSHLRILREIGANADTAKDALALTDYARLAQAVHRSWILNQQLDRGTNPAEVQSLLDSIQDWILGAKLLGAGGGGYLLLFAKDNEAGLRMRKHLLQNPPNPRARFVDFMVSETGLQLTRS